MLEVRLPAAVVVELAAVLCAGPARMTSLTLLPCGCASSPSVVRPDRNSDLDERGRAKKTGTKWLASRTEGGDRVHELQMGKLVQVISTGATPTRRVEPRRLTRRGWSVLISTLPSEECRFSWEPFASTPAP
ncbi:hypothetical protein [Catellatospora sichuanensis]|uniref:hypothetical protein n=1 Tax=Catellatospora sichuanensis TaxID=1969805 RepID=UPI001182C87E|nr:hypothetical protein [Catellatospora sichuanensis]